MSLGDSNDDFAMGDDDYDLAASGEAADGLGDEDFFGEEEGLNLFLYNFGFPFAI